MKLSTTYKPEKSMKKRLKMKVEEKIIGKNYREYFVRFREIHKKKINDITILFNGKMIVFILEGKILSIYYFFKINGLIIGHYYTKKRVK